MYIVLMLIIFVFIILAGVKNKKDEENKINNLALEPNEKILFEAKKNQAIKGVSAAYVIPGMIMTFLGFAAFFESGVAQLYSNLSENVIYLLRCCTFLGIGLIINACCIYIPIDKQSKFDILVVTDKRIFYNKTSENLPLKELLPSAIKNVFSKKNNNSNSKALIIETENEIITFPGFEDVDNLCQILNSVIKANNSVI